jgi:hypothetical protein
LTPKLLPERKAESETYISGESSFKTAEESLAPEMTGEKESLSPQTESVEEESYLETETTDNPLASSSFWTKLRPPLNPYLPPLPTVLKN